jgi:alpha-L-fucosidase
VLSLDQLLSIYYRSVGRGTQLLLNIPVNREGLLADADCASARRFGLEIRKRFAKPLAENEGHGVQVTLKLNAPSRIDTVVLQEDTAKGERVRQYRIEGYAGRTWRTLGEGTSIGHKRIQPLEPITLDALRVVTTKSVGPPVFRSLALFQAGDAPPSDWNASPQIWAADLVGSWRDNAFSIDLTSKIDAAKQYRLRFVPRTGAVTRLTNIVLKLHDVAEPSLVKRAIGKVDELILDITGVAETVQVTGQVEGAASGDILLQKL